MRSSQTKLRLNRVNDACFAGRPLFLRMPATSLWHAELLEMTPVALACREVGDKASYTGTHSVIRSKQPEARAACAVSTALL